VGTSISRKIMRVLQGKSCNQNFYRIKMKKGLPQ
jgi:hypothetical protein